jgi:hypothetical protein
MLTFFSQLVVKIEPVWTTPMRVCLSFGRDSRSLTCSPQSITSGRIGVRIRTFRRRTPAPALSRPHCLLGTNTIIPCRAQVSSTRYALVMRLPDPAETWAAFGKNAARFVARTRTPYWQ